MDLIDYSMTKGAIVSFISHCRFRWLSEIRVNAVVPDRMDSSDTFKRHQRR